MAYEGGDQYAWAKRGGLILLGLLWVLLLQRAVLSHLPLWGVRPDLPLVATVVIALLRGIRWGVGIGAALGLLADLQAGFLIGAHMVSLVSAGAGAGWLAGKIFRDAVIVPAFIVGGLSLLSQGVYLVTANVFGLSLPWGIPFLRPALIAAVYNAVLALGVYPLCLGWLRRTRRGFVVHAEPV